MSPRFYHGLRFKLLLLSLLLLVIPWAGYQYIHETERFLRQTQEETLLGTAQAVAAILNDSPGLVRPVEDAQDPHLPLYVHPLTQSIQLDGYAEEWSPIHDNRARFPANGEPLYELLLGEDRSHLYLLLRVHDRQVIHAAPGSDPSRQGDSVELVTQTADDPPVRYLIATPAPGWVNAQRWRSVGGGSDDLRRESRIQGEWQTDETGYTLELRIPRYLLGDRLALRVNDRDNPQQPDQLRSVSTTAGPAHSGLNRLIRPDPLIGRQIGGLQHARARIWVVDQHRLVLARRGVLSTPDESVGETPLGDVSLLSPLLRLLLEQPYEQFTDERSRSARLGGSELAQALQGEAGTARRQTPDQRAVILSAAWPIRANGEVAGAVVVEQTTNRILSLQHQALENITGIFLVLLLGSGLALLLFASLLTRRIRRLRNRMEAAIASDGRILADLPDDTDRDEIGDLGRSLHNVLNRLREYNRYLEAMASRLAHEFRTPLTIVSSSLENLELAADSTERQAYIDRARDGVERLGTLLQRMREATRLEQQMQQTRLQPFDLGEMLELSVEGYRQAFPGVTFEYQLPAETLWLNGAPDLLHQALDKLVSNAVDFHQPRTPLRLGLCRVRPALLELTLCNQGPPLPPETERSLFDSMVSVRDGAGNEPHLGLGLYLVRLIGEFHGGQVDAYNQQQPPGVCFRLRLPTAD